MLHRRRFAVISLFAAVLMWPATKSAAQTDTKEKPYNYSHKGLSGEANAVLFGVFVLAVCGTFYLCISWTCCFEHEMFYSNEEGCGPCPLDKLEKDLGENTENTSVHLTAENTVDAV